MEYKGVKPVLNENSLNEFALWSKRKWYESKFMCLEDSLMLLLFALKEGDRIEKRNVHFTLNDLTRGIDAQEFNILLTEMKEQLPGESYLNEIQN